MNTKFRAIAREEAMVLLRYDPETGLFRWCSVRLRPRARQFDRPDSSFMGILQTTDKMKNEQTQKMKPQVVVHGEVFVFAAEIPAAATPLQVAGPHLVVADSETTGNHHVVDCVDGVEFLEHEGRRFMRNSKPTQIRCVHAARHDAVTLEPGSYEFGTQQEYDPFTENMRNVRD